MSLAVRPESPACLRYAGTTGHCYAIVEARPDEDWLTAESSNLEWCRAFIARDSRGSSMSIWSHHIDTWWLVPSTAEEP